MCLHFFQTFKCPSVKFNDFLHTDLVLSLSLFWHIIYFVTVVDKVFFFTIIFFT